MTWLGSSLGFWGFASTAFTATTSSLTIAYVARLRHEARLYEAATDRQDRLGAPEPTAACLALARLRLETAAIQLELVRSGGARHPQSGVHRADGGDGPVPGREREASAAAPAKAAPDARPPVAAAARPRKASRPAAGLHALAPPVVAASSPV